MKTFAAMFHSFDTVHEFTEYFLRVQQRKGCSGRLLTKLVIMSFSCPSDSLLIRSASLSTRCFRRKRVADKHTHTPVRNFLCLLSAT